jgi:hypothetical protein
VRDPSHSHDHRNRRRKWRFDEENLFEKRGRQRAALPSLDEFDITDGLPEGDRWSTWISPTRGNAGPSPTRTG